MPELDHVAVHRVSHLDEEVEACRCKERKRKPSSYTVSANATTTNLFLRLNFVAVKAIFFVPPLLFHLKPSNSIIETNEGRSLFFAATPRMRNQDEFFMKRKKKGKKKLIKDFFFQVRENILFLSLSHFKICKRRIRQMDVQYYYGT